MVSRSMVPWEHLSAFSADFLTVLCGSSFWRKDGTHLLRLIDQHVWRLLLERVRCETVSNADGPHPGVPPGAHVHVRVADDRRLIRAHPALLQQLARAFGVGLLRSKAVAAVNLAKELTQPQRLDNRSRGIHRLVREHGHLAGRPVS